jgi:hypothetical protein
MSVKLKQKITSRTSNTTKLRQWNQHNGGMKWNSNFLFYFKNEHKEGGVGKTTTLYNKEKHTKMRTLILFIFTRDN